MEKQSLLIINKTQFGYHIDTLKYCENLKEEFDVTYLCFDTHKEKVHVPGVKVIYIPWKGNVLKKGYTFIKSCKAELARTNYNLIFCVYFQGVSTLINKHNRPKMILDIRTGYVGEQPMKKWLFNAGITLESRFFDRISIISESLAKLLRIKRFSILPLGADVISEKDKDFSTLKLIYVGTLTGRNIHITVEGCKLFFKQTGIQLTYDIYGSGHPADVNRLKKAIGDTTYIHYHGFKHHSELQIAFDQCNVGVSFIPMLPHFDVQPPTKTFEYINSGMICLATATSENKQIIQPKNGVLCLDNAISFADSINFIVNTKQTFSSSKIRSTTVHWSWKNIVKNNLYPILIP